MDLFNDGSVSTHDGPDSDNHWLWSNHLVLRSTSLMWAVAYITSASRQIPLCSYSPLKPLSNTLLIYEGRCGVVAGGGRSPPSQKSRLTRHRLETRPTKLTHWINSSFTSRPNIRTNSSWHQRKRQSASPTIFPPPVSFPAAAIKPGLEPPGTILPVHATCVNCPIHPHFPRGIAGFALMFRPVGNLIGLRASTHFDKIKQRLSQRR